MLGDSLLAAASLVYLGPFSPSLRLSLSTKWRQLCQDNKLQTSASFAMESSLVESEQPQEWFAQGLPKDPNSVQNAIVITQSERWPLIIDPQEQAAKSV